MIRLTRIALAAALAIGVASPGLGQGEDRLETGPGDMEVKVDVAAANETDNLFRMLVRSPNTTELLLSYVLDEAVPLGDVSPEILAAVEQQILTWVTPLPATMTRENIRGYKALARLDPGNALYREKADRYAKNQEANPYAVLNQFKETRDDFREVAFYEHILVPRYVDTESYLEVYPVEKQGDVWLRMRLHYVGKEWLFIRSAEAKIDGQFVDLPVGDWDRDNNSVIWEWADEYMDEELRSIAWKIAFSQETTIRFKGQKYHADYVVPQRDKRVIMESFAAEAALKDKLAAGGV